MLSSPRSFSPQATTSLPSSFSSEPSSFSSSPQSKDRLKPFPLTPEDMETLRQDFGTPLPNLIVTNEARVHRGPRQRRRALTPLDPLPQDAPTLLSSPTTRTRLRRVSGRAPRSARPSVPEAPKPTLPDSSSPLVPEVHVTSPSSPNPPEIPDPSRDQVTLEDHPAWMIERGEETVMMNQVVAIPLSPSSSCSSLSEYEDGTGPSVPMIRVRRRALTIDDILPPLSTPWISGAHAACCV
ncbi:MAG: hypothetical protein DHS80DRAFT_25290 [Piptocephalis tieghemiana]|nr:MAG: hypothetical protein DHS80DRAFT_25290 [Piptocephalis tieghemiana]